jgi:hypothetical protein
MKRIDVTKQGDQWVAKQGGQVVARGDTKQDAVRNTAAVARADPQAVSVKIHKVDGRIQEERTYPRGADPRRSRG